MAVRASIVKKLIDSLKPLHIEVLNESYQHNVPKGSETHFRVVVVSDQFNDTSRVKQHQKIYAILKEELENGVHALAIQSIPSNKWDKAEPEAQDSPQCLGGMKKEKNGTTATKE